MKIINFGSINIDHFYTVLRFVRAGETLASLRYQRCAGGKGFNQSVALGKAGADEVYHVGKIEADGEWLLSELVQAGVNVSNIIIQNEIPTGHAIIQVVSPEGEEGQKGENCILLFGGANQAITSSEIDNVLRQAEAGDIILLQNEINLVAVAEIIEKSHSQGLQIVFNPAPFDENIRGLPLNQIDYLILNETEGAGLAELDSRSDPQEIINNLSERFPKCHIILTLGANGVMYRHGDVQMVIPAQNVSQVVNTTAAGDTFIGYFIAELYRGTEIEEALIMATYAAGICVTREGAATSIPISLEVIIKMNEDLTPVVAAEIQSSVDRLQQQGRSHEEAEEEVAQIIATQAKNDPTVKEKLIRWEESIDTASVTDVVRRVIRLAITYLD